VNSIYFAISAAFQHAFTVDIVESVICTDCFGDRYSDIYREIYINRNRALFREYLLCLMLNDVINMHEAYILEDI
jgi:hypothetical protein